MLKNKNRKILLISNMFPSKKYPSYGTFVKIIENSLVSEGWDTKKVVLYKKNSKILKVFGYLKFFTLTLNSLLLSKDRIIYVHYWIFSGIPLLLFSPKNLVINIHGSDLLPQKKIQKYLLRVTHKLLYKAILIVVPSEYYKELLILKYKINKEKIFVSPSGGIVIPKKIPEKNFDPSYISFGFVGRIEEAKGWQTLLEAVKILPDNFKGKISFVGTGSEEKKLIDISKTLTGHLQNIDIKILGAVPHEKMNSVYQKFDFLIFPSESESLGLVGIEAMANGVPVIGSDVGGIVTYLKDQYNGKVFQAKNYLELSGILNDVFEMDNKSYMEMSKNAIRTASKYESSLVSRELSNKFFSIIEK
ncbi:glycosyltransferase family 4 protein [Lactococcus laudensis]|uniref:glycosyltransferase family 4 protein n=1 Tax=Pseudolactococcus laudensis TaxID=1494461 RepID=UPI002FC83593